MPNTSTPLLFGMEGRWWCTMDIPESKRNKTEQTQNAAGDEARATGLTVEEPAAQSCSSCYTKTAVWEGNPGL